MKKLLLFLILAISLNSYSQSKKLIEQFELYSSTKQFELDDKNIVVSKVIEKVDGNKDDIYIKVKSFFSFNYNDANSVIQTDDKESGVLIAKGSFPKLKVWTDLVGSTNVLSAYHILRVDIKDSRVRVICSVDQWEAIATGSKYKNADVKKGHIVNYAPFTKEKFVDKGKQTEAFLIMIDNMHRIIANLEKSLFEGNVKKENEDW